jgi:PAS domain-containing protein
MLLESTRLLDAFRDALIAFDAALRVTELNRAAGVLFGVTRERAINRPLIEVVRDHQGARTLTGRAFFATHRRSHRERFGSRPVLADWNPAAERPARSGLKLERVR